MFYWSSVLVVTNGNYFDVFNAHGFKMLSHKLQKLFKKHFAV